MNEGRGAAGTPSFFAVEQMRSLEERVRNDLPPGARRQFEELLYDYIHRGFWGNMKRYVEQNSGAATQLYSQDLLDMASMAVDHYMQMTYE